MGHAHSEITERSVPRRIKYELRAAREWFKEKGDAFFCDIVRQEEKKGKRIGMCKATTTHLCPYASRVPFEIGCCIGATIIFRNSKGRLGSPAVGGAPGRVLRRLEKVTPHIIWWFTLRPALGARRASLPVWKTLADDFHWHIEIFFRLSRPRAVHSIKETTSMHVLPEQAAEQLRGRSN